MNQSLHAGGATVQNQIDQESIHTKKLINTLFGWFQNKFKKRIPFNTHEIEKYYQADVQYTVNGVKIAENSVELKACWDDLFAKFSEFKVIQPIEVLASGRQAAINYRLAVSTRDGRKEILRVTAIATLDHDRVKNWQAIVVPDSEEQTTNPVE